MRTNVVSSCPSAHVVSEIQGRVQVEKDSFDQQMHVQDDTVYVEEEIDNAVEMGVAGHRMLKKRVLDVVKK